MSHPGFDGDFAASARLAEGGVCHAESEKVSGRVVGACHAAGFEPGRPIAHVAADLGVPSETPREYVRQAEANEGRRPEMPTSEEREEIRGPRREGSELRRRNEILNAAAVVFAGELDPHRACSSTSSAGASESRICWTLGVSAYYQGATGELGRHVHRPRS